MASAIVRRRNQERSGQPLDPKGYFRADMIDFKKWDMRLEKHLSHVRTGGKEAPATKHEWEIDLSKLDIKHVVSRGTYGTVYRGVYDGKDVADGSHTCSIHEVLETMVIHIKQAGPSEARCSKADSGRISGSTVPSSSWCVLEQRGHDALQWC